MRFFGRQWLTKSVVTQRASRHARGRTGHPSHIPCPRARPRLELLEDRTLPSSNVFAVKFGSTGADSGRAIANDPLGNICVAGTFRGTVDFDPGPGIANLVNPGSNDDVFVAKYDGSGAFIWAK